MSRPNLFSFLPVVILAWVRASTFGFTRRATWTFLLLAGEATFGAADRDGAEAIGTIAASTAAASGVAGESCGTLERASAGTARWSYAVNSLSPPCDRPGSRPLSSRTKSMTRPSRRLSSVR